MIGRILFWMAVVLGAAALTAFMMQHNGRLTLSWDDYVIETSLLAAALGIAAAVFVLYAALTLLHALWRLPGRWRERRRLKRMIRAETDLGSGLIASEQGNWKAAEKALARSARLARNGALYWLGAARMAHQQKAWDRRDAYLQKAREQFPEAYDTIALAEARMLAEERPLKALTLLESLLAQGHDQPAILTEYAQLLARLEQWDKLARWLPHLQKQRALPPERLDELARETWKAQLRSQDSLDALHALWTQLDRRWQEDPDVATTYIRRHMALGDERGLAGLIERLLKWRWHPALVYLYGLLSRPPALKRLQTAEKWLKKHPHDPILLLTLGRLACQARVWGQSQRYLQESLQRHPTLETYSALAECLEAAGETRQAHELYRQALRQLQGPPDAGERPALPATALSLPPTDDRDEAS